MFLLPFSLFLPFFSPFISILPYHFNHSYHYLSTSLHLYISTLICLGIEPCWSLSSTYQELRTQIWSRTYAIYKSRLLQVRHGQSWYYSSYECQSRIRWTVIHSFNSWRKYSFLNVYFIDFFFFYLFLASIIILILYYSHHYSYHSYILYSYDKSKVSYKKLVNNWYASLLQIKFYLSYFSFIFIFFYLFWFFLFFPEIERGPRSYQCIGQRHQTSGRWRCHSC